MSSKSEQIELIKSSLKTHKDLFSDMDALLTGLYQVIETISNSILEGNKIIWLGNGGSAAQSQHFSAELVGRFNMERDPISSLSLSSDMACVTAIGNDYGFSEIYSRQIGSICQPNDIVVCISTSGNSENVLKAADQSQKMGALVVALTGNDGGELAKVSDLSIIVPSSDTARIQEVHLWIGHTICECVEMKVSNRNLHVK